MQWPIVFWFNEGNEQTEKISWVIPFQNHP